MVAAPGVALVLGFNTEQAKTWGSLDHGEDVALRNLGFWNSG